MNMTSADMNTIYIHLNRDYIQSPQAFIHLNIVSIESPQASVHLKAVYIDVKLT